MCGAVEMVQGSMKLHTVHFQNNYHTGVEIDEQISQHDC